MNLDLRTRSDADIPAVDAERFFGVDLPTAAAARPDLVERADHLRLAPLAVEVDGRSWVLRRDGGAIEVEPGTVDETFQLTAEQFADLVNDQITPVGLMTSGAVAFDRTMPRIMDWWLLLRSLLDERPVHRPGDVELPDDLGRSFTLDDDPAELSAYLEAAGYLHLRGVFEPGEMQRISDEMDAAAPEYSEGDGRSWWAGLDSGERALVRMIHFHERSETTAALVADERFLGLAALPGVGRNGPWEFKNRVEGLFKPLGVTEGISDVPWHKDCSLGRHSYDCCNITVGISVTGAGPTSGQLRVIAGSHRALYWPSLMDPSTLDLPDLPLPTDTGDVTIHLSCTMHMAQPPSERERRVLYTGFSLPLFDPEAARDGRQRLSASRESAPLTTSQPRAGS